MFCSKCGKTNNDGAEFCSYCGSKIQPIKIETDENLQKTVGNVKKIIDAIIVRKGKGEPLLIINIKKKLVLKGINPAKYSYETIDDPVALLKLKELINELGVKVQKINGGKK